MNSKLFVKFVSSPKLVNFRNVEITDCYLQWNNTLLFHGGALLGFQYQSSSAVTCLEKLDSKFTSHVLSGM